MDVRNHMSHVFHQQRLESQLSCELFAVRLLSTDAQKSPPWSLGLCRVFSINEINSLLLLFKIAINFCFKYPRVFVQTLKISFTPHVISSIQFTAFYYRSFPYPDCCILLHLLIVLHWNEVTSHFGAKASSVWTSSLYSQAIAAGQQRRPVEKCTSDLQGQHNTPCKVNTSCTRAAPVSTIPPQFCLNHFDID